VAGTTAGATINVLQSPYPVQDEKFTILWTSDIEHSETFTFRNSPDSSGQQLPTGAGAVDLYAYTQSVCEWLQMNPELYRDFIITAATDIITITARQLNVIAFSFSGVSCNGITISNVDGGTLKELRPNFKVLLEIYERSSAGVDTFIGLKSGSPDNDGYVLFDIANQIRNNYNPVPVWPQSSILIERPELLKQFYCRTAESYGSDPVTYAMTTHSLFKGLYGGAGKLKIGSLNNSSLTLLEDHVVNRQRFLTFHPAAKTVDINQPEKLSWYNYGNSFGTIKTKVTALYTDGSERINTESFTSYTGKLYEFLLTPSKLNSWYTWTWVPNHTIYAFKFQILNGSDTPLTEERIYTIDNLPYQENRYFVFLNSLGGFDTLRCTGVFEKNPEYKRNQVTKLLNFDFTHSSPEVVDININESQNYKASTGWLALSGVSGKQMADYLRELFLSPAVWQFTTAGLERIKITSGDVLIDNDNMNLYSLNFEYRKSFSDNLYSPSADDSMNADNAFFGLGFSDGWALNINTQILNNT